jgi:AraC-like DNA-binding protein
VKCARRCYEIDVKQGAPDNISSSLNTLAGIYMSMRQPREAEKYILKGIDYAKKTDNPQRMAVLHGMASEVYQHLGNHERSLYYATEAYAMEKALGRKDKMAIRQAERAPALIALERYDEAQKALNEAIPGLRESGNLHSLAIACNQMGLLMHRADNDSAAVRYYHEALDILIAQHDLYNESRSRQGLYEALRQTNPAKAMEHNDRYLELRDSLYDKDTGELLSKYAAEYGVGELKAENRQMQNYIIIGIVGLVVLVCLGCVLVWWMRRRQKQRIAQLIKQIETLKPQPSVVEEQPNEVVEENNEDHKFLMKLVEVVNASLPTGHYGVEQIAQEMNMSVQTFRRRLLSATGESPKAFISALQMERAAKLLTDNPDMPISRVATLCGYDETNSFGRSFKRFYNLTPSQYRDKTA